MRFGNWGKALEWRRTNTHERPVGHRAPRPYWTAAGRCSGADGRAPCGGGRHLLAPRFRGGGGEREGEGAGELEGAAPCGARGGQRPKGGTEGVPVGRAARPSVGVVREEGVRGARMRSLLLVSPSVAAGISGSCEGCGAANGAVRIAPSRGRR